MQNRFSMVLSGGGAKGAYQVGAFKAMSEYPIEINAVSGSSIGGINALAYVSLSQSRIEELWNDFKMDSFINPDDDWSDGISDRNALESILDEIVDEKKLSEVIPVYNTICQNDTTPEYIKLNGKSKRDIIDVVLATSALPVIYSKVSINNILYQDGGIADNLPVAPLYNEGNRSFIVVSLSKNLRVDKSRFPMDNLIEIYPSYSLGDLVDGTLNFSPKYISFAKKLGYADAKRALNEYYGYDNGCHTAEFDFTQIEREVKSEAIQRDIDRNMDNLMKYFD